MQPRFTDSNGNIIYVARKKSEHEDTKKKYYNLKCIQKTFENTSPAKIFKEIKIMSGLHHANIVKLHEVIESKDSVNIAMELCSGGNIADYIAKSGPFTEKQSRKILKSCLEAVDYMHKNLIFHRNLNT